MVRQRETKQGMGVRRAGPAPEVRLGFVPLNDCAPLLVAEARGLFGHHGLRVRLSRELGWASVRAKLAFGELDATHAPATFPFTLSQGIDGPAAGCETALVLNLNGNAITLSRRLAEAGVRDAPTFAAWLARHRGDPPTFGVVSAHSSHPFLLHRWLAGGGLEPGRDVRVVVVPPAQMCANLRAGHLDGFCVGEPWNSVAILAGDGWCAATSGDLAPRHPEKVLAVRSTWAASHPTEHVRLVAAILEACRICDDPASRGEVVALLAGPSALNLPAHLLRPAWDGEFPLTRNTSVRLPEFNVFHRFDANEPSREKAAWVAQNLLPASRSDVTPEHLGRVFRMDVFEAACRLTPFRRDPESDPACENESNSLPA